MARLTCTRPKPLQACPWPFSARGVPEASVPGHGGQGACSWPRHGTYQCPQGLRNSGSLSGTSAQCCEGEETREMEVDEARGKTDAETFPSD